VPGGGLAGGGDNGGGYGRSLADTIAIQLQTLQIAAEAK
jgi:hypothetical protein